MPFIKLCAAFLLLLALPITASANETPENAKSVILAGGCFWCMEAPFEALDGVYEVTSGYSGGHVENPTYKQVTKGGTGHLEVVKVTYDPEKVSFEKLMHIFWRNVDPFDYAGQFCDKGDSYKTAIFVENDEERRIAEKSKKDLEDKFNGKLATPVLDRKPFYEAEDYHQDYYKNNSFRYNFYRGRCGRDNRLEQIWKDEAGGGTKH